MHSAAAPLTGGLSPVSLSLAMADWAWHLGVSPGRQMELAALATQLLRDTLQTRDGVAEGAGAADDDPRFRHEAWATWPFSQMRAGFRNAEAFWREATRVPGMTAHHADLTQFFARQLLGVMAPANWLPTNPVVSERRGIESNGTHLVKGAAELVADVTGVPHRDDRAQQNRFKVGRDVAVTPGQVVYRNRLIELIRYDAQTDKVHPEPVFIIPSWIMKYYILDLSPHNSMVRYLVGQGHTVYMLSWCNPAASDHDLTMDDYLRLGVLDAVAGRWAIWPKATRPGAHHGLLPGWHTAGHRSRGPGQGRPARGHGPHGPAAPQDPHPAGGTDRFFRARRTRPVHRREPDRLLDNVTTRQGLPERQPDGGIVPVPAFARPGVDAAHARVPDG